MIEKEPHAIVCYFCSTPGMEKKHRVETSKFVRVLWLCSRCGHGASFRANSSDEKTGNNTGHSVEETAVTILKSIVNELQRPTETMKNVSRIHFR